MLKVNYNSNHYLYNAVYQLSLGRETAIEGKLSQPDTVSKIVKLIDKKYKPVVVCNVLITTILSTFFKHEDNNDESSRFMLNNGKLFEVLTDIMLPGSHNKFIIFDEDTFDTSEIVTYDINL